MKKLVLTAVLLALLAAPSFAYVQSGQMLQNAPQGRSTDTRVRLNRWVDGAPPVNPEPVVDPLVEGPARPIPEPGTMILASLGLLALGVSRAKRRGH